MDNSPITNSAPKTLRSNAAWNLFSTVWLTAVSLFLTPFLIRNIGSDQYGLYILLLSITGFLGFMNLGLGEATLRFVAYHFGRNDLEGINRVFGATLYVYCITAVMIGVSMYCSAPYLVKVLAIPQKDYELGTKFLRITAVNFGFVSIMNTISYVAKAILRFDVSSKIVIAQSVFQVVGTVVLIENGFGIYELLLLTLANSLVMIILNIIVLKKLIPKIQIWPRYSKEGIREVFGYGVYSIITNILGTIWSQIDRILLGTMVSTASVAYLSVPKNVTLRANSAIGNVGSVLFPKFSAMKDKSEIERLFLHSTWLFLSASVMIFVPMTVLMPDFLRLWINPEFAIKSAWVGQVVACSCIVRGSFVPYENLFRGLGKPNYLTVVLFASGTSSIILNFVLISKFGLSGAGYAYMFTIFWGFCAIVFAWKKVLRMDTIRPLFRVVILPIFIGFAAVIISSIARSSIGNIGWTELFVFCASTVFATGMGICIGEYIASGGIMKETIFMRLLVGKRISAKYFSVKI